MKRRRIHKGERIVPTYETDPKRVIFPDEPIQWHLPRSTYDRCPDCGSPLGYLGRTRRACLGLGSQVSPCDPGKTFESTLTPRAFFIEMINRGRTAQRIGWKQPVMNETVEAATVIPLPVEPPPFARQSALFPDTREPTMGSLEAARELGVPRQRVYDLEKYGKLTRVTVPPLPGQPPSRGLRLTVASVQAYKAAAPPGRRRRA